MPLSCCCPWVSRRHWSTGRVRERLPALAEYLPGKGELAQVAVPCVVTAGADSRDPASPVHYHFEASSWLADQLGTPLVEVPGAHVPHLTHPQEFIEALRPTFERMWPIT